MNNLILLVVIGILLVVEIGHTVLYYHQQKRLRELEETLKSVEKSLLKVYEDEKRNVILNFALRMLVKYYVSIEDYENAKRAQDTFNELNRK